MYQFSARHGGYIIYVVFLHSLNQYTTDTDTDSHTCLANVPLHLHKHSGTDSRIWLIVCIWGTSETETQYNASCYLLYLWQRLRHQKYRNSSSELSEEMGSPAGQLRTVKLAETLKLQNNIPGETTEGEEKATAHGTRELWQSYQRRNKGEGTDQDEPESLRWL